MRRTIRTVALSMLMAALTLSAVAITPEPGWSQDGGAITLYTDPGTGQVFTKRCKHCVRLGAYIPADTTREIERKVERSPSSNWTRNARRCRLKRSARPSSSSGTPRWRNKYPRFSRGRRSSAIAGIRNLGRHAQIRILRLLDTHWLRSAVPGRQHAVARPWEQLLQPICPQPGLSGLQVHSE